MPGSVVSTFGGPQDFEAALAEEGVRTLLVTGRGAFRARLTRIALDRLRLAAVEEQLARVVFLAVPAETVLVALATGIGVSQVCGGIAMRPGEIVTIAPGERLHARSTGPCVWSTIRAPRDELLHYGWLLSPAGFSIPPGVACWRPAGRELHDLHRAAIRMAETRPSALAHGEAAHGLEQQLLHALIDCLAGGPTRTETPAGRRQREVAACFEALLADDPFARLADICNSLDVSERALRGYCRTHLGMGPSDYRRRRALQAVHRALCATDPEGTSVAAAARQFGFHDPGRFAGRYRALYGELPSATLRRRRSRGLPPLSRTLAAEPDC